MSSQDEREDDDAAAQNLPPTPAPSWIREGVALIVTDGNKNVEYAAHVKSRPFLCDNVWFVTIKYDLSCELADVECSRCNVIDLEGKRPKRFRRTVKQEKCVIEPPEIIDVQSFSSFSFSEVGGDGNEQAVARLPLQEDDSVAFGADFFPAVTPSPTREATSFNIPKKRGLDSLAQVSDELFGADDSDEDSVMNKKPAAREKSTRDYNEADVVEEEDSRQLENAEKFEAAKNVLGNLEYSPKEVEAALHAIGPPYTNLQTAALQIQRQRRLNQNSSVFEVEIGMTFRKPFDGTEYEGVVLSKVNEKVKKGDGRAVNVWKVVYSDGDEEELDYDELLRFRYPRPEVASCLGRPMQGLELFCGEYYVAHLSMIVAFVIDFEITLCTTGRGIVSQEFRQRQWKMESVDFAETSNATIKTDILDLEITKLPFVPDFIWISFDCSTYSKAAGGLHRSAKRGRFEKTSKAKLNNLSFLKTVRICKWARSLHPHVIIAIENPVGQLQCMPLMVSSVFVAVGRSWMCHVPREADLVPL